MRNKLVGKSIPFSAFVADYYLKCLKLYSKHKFLFIILLKNNVVNEEEVWSTRDIAQAVSPIPRTETAREFWSPWYYSLP